MKNEIKNDRQSKEDRHMMQLIRRKMITKKKESVHIYKRKSRTHKNEN
jgi:uncharacterized protein YqeY